MFWESDVNYNHATKRNESLVTVAVSLRHLVVSPLASLEVYVIILYIAAGLETIGSSCVVHGVVVVVVVLCTCVGRGDPLYVRTHLF